MEEQEGYGNKTEEERRYTQRLPELLWKLCRYHQIETGESMNALVIRLLTGFFKSKGKLPQE